MGKLLALGLLGVIVIVGAIGSIGNDKSHGSNTASADDRPGAATVYREIATTYDCPRLQEMFDTASANNDREEPLSYLFEATLGYMDAADDRMDALGCYD
jgi:hypothetical protein